MIKVNCNMDLIEETYDVSSDAEDATKVQVQINDCPPFVKRCNELLEKLANNYKDQRQEIKHIIKMYNKERRNMHLSGKRRKRDKPTGFTIPTEVPEKLCDYLGLERNCQMSRVDITKKIYAEIRKRELVYEKDKRIFRADDETKALFGLPDNINECISVKDDGFTFFTLQKYIARCYPKKGDRKENGIPTESTHCAPACN
jgi:hypothetical protein